MNAEVLAIDVGGTKLSAAWVDHEGAVRGHRTVETPAAEPGRPEVAWQALSDLIDVVLREPPPAMLGVGIATAGPIDHLRQTVSPVNLPAWREFPLLRHVQSRLPDATVRLAGDAICAAIGEHWLGAGRGSRDMLGVVVSTGIGGGLILGNRLHVGRTGNAGHIGHLIVDFDAEPCCCGGLGCAEAIASGPSLVRWANAQGFPVPTARDLAAAAAEGEPVAVAAFDRAGRALAAAFISTAVTCDLDRVVVGGGVAGAGAILFDPIRRWAREYGKLHFVSDLEITPAILKEHAGLVGAAALLHEEVRYPTT